MSIQVYVCPTHGEHEVFIRKVDIPKLAICPGCGKPIALTVSLPAPPKVTETWNDKANRCRVNPYDQAKEQFRNLSNENQLHHDHKPLKVTEKGLQVAAEQIDRRNRGFRPGTMQQQKQRLNKKQT